MSKLYIALVGLPARGKSFMAVRLQEGLEADGLKVRIFNNGNLRREMLGPASSRPEFYSPDNKEGRRQREKIAKISRLEAKKFLDTGGNVAIMDATNGSRTRRKDTEEYLNDAPILYIECINDDPELLAASIQRKARLPEFADLSMEDAVKSFERRIDYYASIFTPLAGEKCFARVESVYNKIVEEHACDGIPYYSQIRDILISDWVRNLYLARHGESLYNLEQRIGGDSSLTPRGRKQAEDLAGHFKDITIPYIFTSAKQRSCQTAAPTASNHPNSIVIPLPEFDEIDAGICDSMTYREIQRAMPHEFAARSRDKYGYVYPGGEGYATMKERVSKGFRKAMFISGAAPGILIIGHQAINRMILSLFLYRRDEAVPYIYVPQEEYFHIVITHRKKLMELIRYSSGS